MERDPDASAAGDSRAGPSRTSTGTMMSHSSRGKSSISMGRGECVPHKAASTLAPDTALSGDSHTGTALPHPATSGRRENMPGAPDEAGGGGETPSAYAAAVQSTAASTNSTATAALRLSLQSSRHNRPPVVNARTGAPNRRRLACADPPRARSSRPNKSRAALHRSTSPLPSGGWPALASGPSRPPRFTSPSAGRPVNPNQWDAWRSPLLSGQIGASHGVLPWVQLPSTRQYCGHRDSSRARVEKQAVGLGGRGGIGFAFAAAAAGGGGGGSAPFHPHTARTLERRVARSCPIDTTYPGASRCAASMPTTSFPTHHRADTDVSIFMQLSSRGRTWLCSCKSPPPSAAASTPRSSPASSAGRETGVAAPPPLLHVVDVSTSHTRAANDAHVTQSGRRGTPPEDHRRKSRVAGGSAKHRPRVLIASDSSRALIPGVAMAFSVVDRVRSTSLILVVGQYVRRTRVWPHLAPPTARGGVRGGIPARVCTGRARERAKKPAGRARCLLFLKLVCQRFLFFDCARSCL